jgi:hypothetical protein
MHYRGILTRRLLDQRLHREWHKERLQSDSTSLLACHRHADVGRIAGLGLEEW